jgi:hypothetical protein
MTGPSLRFTRILILTCFLLLLLPAAYGQAGGDETIIPATFLNFNEGSGVTALDASGNGNAGTIFNVSRLESGVCGGALLFNRIDNFVSIPYRSTNHPENEITVSTWFLVDSFEPQDLISADNNGGYSLRFADGNDLWWTVSLRGTGDVSVPVQHEGIATGQWHFVTATYDGKSSKIFMDGVLRNQVNASGPIVYQNRNYVILGANAGGTDTPDASCPRYFHGGLDEVRIYNRAIPFGQIIADRFHCPQEPVVPAPKSLAGGNPFTFCSPNSGTISLGPGETATRTLTFTDRALNATWHVILQPGSKLIVNTKDLFPQASPDAWYVELADEKGRVDRSVIFPNTNNAPVEGVIPSGNATVRVRYFDGKERFPASVELQFVAIAPPPAPPTPPQSILNNPIIVIYSASWATIIALILVIFWLHRRSKVREQDTKTKEETETKKD